MKHSDTNNGSHEILRSALIKPTVRCIGWHWVYLVRGCWDQDGVFQLGEGLLDVEQHA